jgi:cyclohexanecarboxylate-CoA ligase
VVEAEIDTNAVQWPPAAIRPSTETVEKYCGLWHTQHLLADLDRHRGERPDKTAIVGYHADGPAETLTWARYAEEVERFASALRALGVGPGQVVGIQAPNWWETSALILAVMRTGAVVAPVIAALRSRELERAFAQLRATVVVTIGEWEGYDHAAALAEMAGRLPYLRHRVVIGRAAGVDEISFEEHFRRASWVDQYPMPLGDEVDPNRVALGLFTSGTSGEPKAVLHTSNTLAAASADMMAEEQERDKEGLKLSEQAAYTPHNLTHIMSITVSIIMPLLTGGRAVLFDAWAPGRIAEIIQEAQVTMLAAASFFVDAIVKATTAAGGWFNTGDLVVPDGRGGIRLVGRAADRVGGALMIPIADVEAQLLEHPAIADVAVVGYLDAEGQETGCAVLVSAGTAPTLDEVRAYLTAEGMTEFYQPTRVETMDVLPRNANGKILKRELRTWVQQRTGTPE